MSNSIILGVDPSYTRTGVFHLETLLFKTIVVSNKSVHKIHEAVQMASILANEIVNNSFPFNVIAVEYPILATRSGSYLGLITQSIYTEIKHSGFKGKLIFIPSQAINSVTLNKSKQKTHIVNWVKDKYKITDKINHDEASSAVIAYIAQLIEKGEYKNSYSVIEFK